MKVIGIIGQKSSGKDTIAKYIQEKYGAYRHSHSEILDDILSALHVEHTRANEMKLAALRRVFGENTLVNALNKKVKNENAEIQVITGIRFDNELKNIRAFPENKVIFLDTAAKLRYERQVKRNEKADDSALNYEEFLQNDLKETEVNIRKLGKQADYVIVNNGNEQELFNKIDSIMKEII